MVINNVQKIVNEINNLDIWGMDAVAEDGSVCVRVTGSKARIWDVAKLIEAKFADVQSVGDGIQEGTIWINNDELSEAVNKF